MATGEKKYRLVTRSDFDGLVCAVLLRTRGLIDEIKFVHPKDMQDGLIAISDDDITTNLPYIEGVHLAFDHHYSETVRVGEKDNYIIDPDAPSAARVVYDYYGGAEAFPAVSEAMMTAVDKGDSADFTEDEVLHPEDWNLLNFIMDARTGLGRFRNFRISNYQLMMDLIEYCADHDIDDILSLPDVAERVELYFEHQDKFRAQMENAGHLDGSVLKIDLRGEETIYAGNRFVKYALFPEANVSVQVIWGFKRQNTVLTVGKSIFNRTCDVNIGDLMLSYGGGGHGNAGTCQVPNDDAERVLGEVIATLKA
ncbi:MAG: exopolyphosphatase [Spirochaeta sp.]|jgi:nanoRNase/pAp phosphatase (c-di-AMP/oligoRNAs hydrolase)|nr:exopolyphosphatase [Spirochaeta sp.]